MKTMSQIAQEKILKINKILAKSQCVHHGLLGGSLGLLYYYYHAAKVFNDGSLNQKAEALLIEVFDDINNNKGHLIGSLYSSGGAGLGFTIDYLQKYKFIDFDIESEFIDLDKYLFDEAIIQIKKDNIDYLHGAMGVFHYFSSREQTPKVSEYLNTISLVICNKAIHANEGIYFCNTGLERLTKNDVDLGLAHGLCGILLLLINAWPFLSNKPQVETIINLGVQYIIKHELPVNFPQEEFSFFSFELKLATNEISRVNRLAWCYGDLNQVLLLYRAGKLLGNSEYTAIADRIGLQQIHRKSINSTLSTDAHFCHGSAGLAQFYKCLYNETLNYSYYKAYEFWIEETLSLIDKEIENNNYSTNPVSLLEGWPGIALVLLDYIAIEKTPWAKAFLL